MRTKMIYILLWWPSWYLLFFMHRTEVIATSGVEGGPDLQAVPSTCKKTINGCPNQNAEKKCKKCCRNAGCNRGDCKKNKQTIRKWKCVCNCDLQWVVTEKISSYGQNLTLFCSVDNCCNEDAGWTEEGSTIFLDFKTYKNATNNTKYGSTYNESGFGLVIPNLSETDLNKTFECTYGFKKSTHQYLLQEDVFRKDGPSTDKENRTTDDPSTDEEISTTDEGDDTIIIVAVIVSALLIIALIVIPLIICWYRRQQHPINPVHYNAVQQQERNEPSPTWCRCTHCREMPSEVERVCCDKDPQNCSSRHQDFDLIVHVDEIYQQATGNIDRSEMRKESYEKLCVWLDWPLGAGNRRPLPSCCVWKIRDKYPYMYCGFLDNI